MRKYLLMGGLITLLFFGLILSGCMIHGPDIPTKVPNILKLSPSDLEGLPKGSIYAGWLVNGELDDKGEWIADDPSTWLKFGEFNWDPYSYQPTDARGQIIENSFVVDVSILDYDRIFITIESTKSSEVSSGTVILQGEVDQLNIDADLEHPISTAAISDFTPENWYYVYSQSDGPWYDNETVENGIWFGEVGEQDVIWFDTLGIAFYCEDPEEPGEWDTCANIPPEEYDSVYYEFIRDDTLAIYLCFDDSLEIYQECARSYDSLHYFEILHVDTNGDTTISSSLTTMPDAVDGWKYEAWLTFTEDSPYKKPLSLGKFSSPDGPDDDTSYSYLSGYDRHFNIPGEDFFHSVPFFGRLDVIESPYVDRLFITVEPDPDFDEDEPFWQLIMFSNYLPKMNVFYSSISGEPITLQWPFVVRDIGYELNDGHRWPLMHIDFERELILEE